MYNCCKGVRRDAVGINFESYANRINTLRNIDSELAQKKINAKKVTGKTYRNEDDSVNNVQFASLNNKPYYISDGIVSLPFGHLLFSELRELKKSYLKIQKYIKLLQKMKDLEFYGAFTCSQ